MSHIATPRREPPLAAAGMAGEVSPGAAGAWRVVRRLLSVPGIDWRRLGAAAVAGGLCSASGIALVATSAWLISRAAERPPILSLTVAIVAVRFLGISRGVLRYAERLLTHDAGFRYLAALRTEVYRAVEPTAPSGLGAMRSGDMLRRLVGDVDRIQSVVVRVVVPTAVVASTVVVAVALSGAILPAAGIAVACGMAVGAVGIPWLCGRLAASRAAAIAGLRGELQARVVDLLQGAPDLLAFGAVDAHMEGIRDLDARICRSARRQAWIAAAGGAAVVLVAGLTLWVALLVAIPAVLDGRVGGTMLAAVALLPLAAFEPVMSFPATLVELREALGSARRVVELLDRPPAVVDPDVPRPLPTGAVLTLDGVSVDLPGRGMVLDGASGTLAAGRRIIVTGPSGSGKTTLAHALLRFVAPTAGRITLGGVPVDELRQAEVRTRIGLCEDRPHIFATSVRENLRLARPGASDEELRAAARRARILDWIEALPQGWDTLLGERGADISGGQRRRLALARALLADFPVLVLDEPTANLDADTARQVMRDLLCATRDRTTLVITHDVDAVEDADEVWYLRDGRLVERRTAGLRLAAVAVA